MFWQVQGEGLNVGCVLTRGPCFEYQRQYFGTEANMFGTEDTLLKYDLEISGFGSQALGHVCLLNLKDQTYPEWFPLTARSTKLKRRSRSGKAVGSRCVISLNCIPIPSTWS
jgi:hypothetical protein